MKNLKNIFKLFNPNENKNFYLILLFIFFGMFLEALGIGVIFPALNLILDPNFIETYNFGNLTNQNFFTLILLLFFLLYLVRFLFLVFLSYFQNKFVSFFCHRVTKDLLSGYIHQDYKYFIKTNTSGLIKNILVETTHFMSYFSSAITLLTELTFIVAIISIIIFIEPLGTISVIVFFGISAFLILNLTKNRLSSWGEMRQEIDKSISKNVHEGFGAIKEIKVNKIENFFIDNFNKSIFKKANIHFKHLFVSQLPKNLFELTAIFGMLFFGAILFFQNEEINSIISKSGMFVGASFKLIGSLNKVISNIQQMKYYDASVAIIINEYFSNQKPKEASKKDSKIQFNHQITFKKVSYQYNENSKILNDLNFNINKGEVIGITGESGAGKSTILDLLLGIIEPSSGQILVDDLALSSKNYHEWTPHISYVPQFVYLLDNSILDNIILNDYTSKVDQKKLADTLYKSNVENFLLKKKDKLNSVVGEKGNNLSGGQLQRIGIARALYKDSDVLILDEFTSNIDLNNEIEIMRRIMKDKNDKTIILTSHRKETLTFCDRILHIENGLLNEVK